MLMVQSFPTLNWPKNGKITKLSQSQNVIALQYNTKVNNTEKTYNKVFPSAVECCSHQLSCLDLKLNSSTQSRTEYLSISCWEGGRGAKEGGEMEGWTEGRGGR